MKRAGGRRYYRPSDVALLAGIKRLLHDEGLTIRGVQRILRDQGVRHVAGIGDGTVEDVLTTVLAPGEAAGDMADDTHLPDADVASAPVPVADAAEPAPAPLAAEVAPKTTPVQAPLPLFDLPPASAPVPPAEATATAPPPPRSGKPFLREDATHAALLRAAAPGTLSGEPAQLAAVARRLQVLRDLMAARAEGGGG